MSTGPSEQVPGVSPTMTAPPEKPGWERNAIIAAVAGALGAIGLAVGWGGIALGVAAIVAGVRALRSIKASGAKGKPLAILGIVLGAIFVVVGGWRWLDAMDTNANQPTEVGQCFTIPADATTTEDTRLVDCTSPHDGEVFAVMTLEGDFPGQDALVAQAEEFCLAQFDGYVGTPFADSALTFGYTFPGQDQWGTSDPAITCYLATMDGTQRTESAQGSGL